MGRGLYYASSAEGSGDARTNCLHLFGDASVASWASRSRTGSQPVALAGPSLIEQHRFMTILWLRRGTLSIDEARQRGALLEQRRNGSSALSIAVACIVLEANRSA